MASHPAYADYEPESDSGAFFKAAAVLLGIAVGIVGFFALMLWSDARNARDDAQAASAVAQPAAQEHAGALPLNSFAGVAPPNAAALAEAHKPYPATLPPVTPGDVAKVHMALKDVTIQIAPGIKYAAWGFDGRRARARSCTRGRDRLVEMTLTNDGAIPHSIDFHAARIAPNIAFRDVDAGQVLHVPASRPATRACSCTTAARSRC